MTQRILLSVCVFLLITTATSAERPNVQSTNTPTQWQPEVNYKTISPALTTDAKTGHVQVTEFFWYACPHCFKLEQGVQDWLSTRPDYIEFKRVHIAWAPVQHAHARLYYVLQKLNRGDLDSKVMAEIHERKNPLFVEDNEKETFRIQQEFAASHGIPRTAFKEAFDSAEVRATLDSATKLATDSKVDGVPAFTVGGKYLTKVSLAGNDTNLFAIVNHLAAQQKDQLTSR